MVDLIKRNTVHLINLASVSLVRDYLMAVLKKLRERKESQVWGKAVGNLEASQKTEDIS